MNKSPDKRIYFLLALWAILLPSSALASTIYVDTDHSEFFVGDSIMFSVRIDSEDKSLNVVEGNLLLDFPDDSVALVDINTSDSKLSLWPQKPFPSLDNRVISFAGGIPSGFNSQDATIFNVVLEFKAAGEVRLKPDRIGIYLNDGKGTRDEVSIKDLVVNVLPSQSGSQPQNDWTDMMSKDRTPPEPFEIYLGQESSVFENKKFLSFSTTDKQSEIAYYEVIEGDLPPVRSENTYVLREQEGPVKVTVIAYDSVGNARKATYNSAPNKFLYPVISIIAVLIIVFVIIKRRGVC